MKQKKKRKSNHHHHQRRFFSLFCRHCRNKKATITTLSEQGTSFFIVGVFFSSLQLSHKKNSLQAIFFSSLFSCLWLYRGPASGSNNSLSEPQQELLKQIVLREHCRQKTASRLACPPWFYFFLCSIHSSRTNVWKRANQIKHIYISDQSTNFFLWILLSLPLLEINLITTIL